MKKSLKISILVLSVFLIFLVLTPIFSFSQLIADASNYRGDYISICYQLSSEGKILCSLDFGLNTEARGLKDNNEKAEYRLNIQLMAQKLLDKKKIEFNDKFIENQIDGFAPSDCIIYSPAIYDQNSDSVGFKITYSNIETYNFYNSKASDYDKVSKNWLYNKKEKKRVFPFAEMVQTESGEKTLARYYLNEFISACKGLSIESKMMIYNPDFIFDITVDSNRVRSNADLLYTDQDGRHHHAWGETVANINQDIIVSLSLTTANRGWWYLFGVGIPLLVMGGAIVVVKTKEKHKKKIETA